MPRTIFIRCATAMVVVAAFCMSLSAPAADAATPLAGAKVTVNRPTLESLLRICITSQTLDPKGTCLTEGPSRPAVTGQLYGGFNFSEPSEASVGLYFVNIGAPSLFTGYFGHRSFVGTVARILTPHSFPYDAYYESGTCVARDPGGTGVGVAGVNYPGLPVDAITQPSNVVITVPMWGELQCNGPFAGHSGPFTVAFAGTAEFHQKIYDPCCPFGHFQGGYAIVFGT